MAPALPLFSVFRLARVCYLSRRDPTPPRRTGAATMRYSIAPRVASGTRTSIVLRISRSSDMLSVAEGPDPSATHGCSNGAILDRASCRRWHPHLRLYSLVLRCRCLSVVFSFGIHLYCHVIPVSVGVFSRSVFSVPVPLYHLQQSRRTHNDNIYIT